MHPHEKSCCELPLHECNCSALPPKPSNKLFEFLLLFFSIFSIVPFLLVDICSRLIAFVYIMVCFLINTSYYFDSDQEYNQGNSWICYVSILILCISLVCLFYPFIEDMVLKTNLHFDK